jgi:aminodeoxyfutalosine synthase
VSAVLDQYLLKSNPLAEIANKVHQGERISEADALKLYETEDIIGLGVLAEFVRRRAAGPGREKYVYYIHNMHLNPTNFCVQTCRFCSYANPAGKDSAYTWSVDKVMEEASTGAKLGINEIHMVGGLNPACNLDYFVDVLKAIKREYPHIHMKALTAVEIEYLANLEGISFEQTLQTLIDAGLGSMPGGGAEIFDDAVRERMAVNKTSADVWLEIHGIAHKLGVKSNATMLTGISENRENKVDHIARLRKQQDISGGFQCFIPLKCYYEGTNIRDEVTEPSAHELLRDVAVSRIFLDNFPHIKAYWIQLGETVAQVALSFGADDLDGTIGKEKITHAAGAQTPLQLAKERMEELITSAGYQPVERDTVYNIKRVVETPLVEHPRAWLEERVAALA